MIFFSCLPLAVNNNTLFGFFPDNLFHAAVCSVCNAELGWFHSLLSERSAGEVPGRLSVGE